MIIDAFGPNGRSVWPKIVCVRTPLQNNPVLFSWTFLQINDRMNLLV